MQVISLRRPVGYFTLVDDDDGGWVASLRLRATLHVRRWNPHPPIIYVRHGRRSLHTMVMERHAPLGRLVVDHRNGIGWDCRRSNLRAVRLEHASALGRMTYRGIEIGRDVDEKGRYKNTKHYTVFHADKKIGVYPSHEQALAAKVEAEQLAGYPVVEDRAALLPELIDLLEQCVRDGRLRRHVQDAPQIENRYRIARPT